MTVETGPTARQRRLASELRRLRERAELTPEAAAGIIGWSRPKLVKIETARNIPTVADVVQILDAYGDMDDAVRLALLELARTIRRRGWWVAYEDVLAGSYVELEDAADSIKSWQVQVVPGLLQTPEYARALIKEHIPDDPEEIDRRVQARMTRKTLFARQEPPRVSVLLLEEVLRRPVGGPKVMLGQLTALREAAELPNVSIRVLPISVGQYPVIGEGAMVIFEFPSPLDLSTAYLETLAGGIYVENYIDVKRCNMAFDKLVDATLSEQDTIKLISDVIKE
ncbi:helix-turn-helix domain-containing protein [Actinomadura hibisca]|uniref:helix-turn-helix domain-containing protein n=1 Tax=Actinomadura hibisca TaxID=68565 RepID=UPI00082D852F|nr:helix-turn-helix transcriptional regulator [Actinomadura hibisca]